MRASKPHIGVSRQIHHRLWYFQDEPLNAVAAPFFVSNSLAFYPYMTIASIQQFTAVVLAADRTPNDPVAQAAKVSCKALAPVGGRPMFCGSLTLWPGLTKLTPVYFAAR